jgi:hypothetical protein
MNSNHAEQTNQGTSSPARRFRPSNVSVIAIAACMVGGISPSQAQQGALKSETVDNSWTSLRTIW